MKVGKALRSLLPSALKAKVPAAAPARAHRWPTRQHPRKVLLLMGCVQPAMLPNINSATARVLDAAGIQTLVADQRRLLRRDPPAPRRSRRRARPHAQQHRRLVADGRERRGRGDRHERLGLRRDGEGVRPLARARPALRDQGRSHRRSDARPVRAAARAGRPAPLAAHARRASGEGRQPARNADAPRLPSALHAAARPARARRGRDEG